MKAPYTSVVFSPLSGVPEGRPISGFTTGSFDRIPKRPQSAGDPTKSVLGFWVHKQNRGTGHKFLSLAASNQECSSHVLCPGKWCCGMSHAKTMSGSPAHLYGRFKVWEWPTPSFSGYPESTDFFFGSLCSSKDFAGFHDFFSGDSNQPTADHKKASSTNAHPVPLSGIPHYYILCGPLVRNRGCVYVFRLDDPQVGACMHVHVWRTLPLACAPQRMNLVLCACAGAEGSCRRRPGRADPRQVRSRPPRVVHPTHERGDRHDHAGE